MPEPDLDPSFLVTAVAASLSLLMMLAWLHQGRLGNAGWVDVFWTAGTGLAGLAFALVPLDAPGTLTPRQILVALLELAWSFRLLLYSVGRASRGRENARHANLRRHWGLQFQRRFFGLLQLKALAALVLSLAVFAAARNPEPWLGTMDWIGAGIVVVSIMGAGVADHQLRRFRRDDPGERGICDRGLWAWSRHPNYFFEWLGWAAYPLIAVAPPAEYSWGWGALAAPIAMYWLLVHVWGIPYAEPQLVARCGDAYRTYRARTSAFFPVRPSPRISQAHDAQTGRAQTQVSEA